MPTYVYICTKCGEIMEIDATSQKIFEVEEDLRCDKCGSAVKRKLAPFVTHFNFTRGNHEEKRNKKS